MMRLLLECATALALLAAMLLFAGEARGDAPPAGAVARTAGGPSLPELALRERATREDLVWVLVRLPGVAGALGSSGRLAEAPGPALGSYSFEAAAKELEARGLFDGRFVSRPGRALTRGDAALPFARFLGLRGGASGRFFGLGRRVAYRQMADLGLMPAGGERAVMTGAELIGVLDLVRQRALKKGGKP